MAKKIKYYGCISLSKKQYIAVQSTILIVAAFLYFHPISETLLGGHARKVIIGIALLEICELLYFKYKFRHVETG